MLTLDLCINEIEFRLGDRPDPARLTSARCKKAGFLTRRAATAGPDQILFWAKNPTIDCFGGEVTLWPSGCGTSAYLYYGPVGLEKVTLQIFGSTVMAHGSTLQFRQLSAAAFGEPDTESQQIAIWQRDGFVVASELSAGANRAWYVWTVDDRNTLA